MDRGGSDHAAAAAVQAPLAPVAASGVAASISHPKAGPDPAYQAYYPPPLYHYKCTIDATFSHQDPALSPAMAPADLLALLQPHGQQHLLDHWDDLDAKQQEDFRAELTALDLKEVCGYFARTAESMKNTTEKLDDKMQPLQGGGEVFGPGAGQLCQRFLRGDQQG